MLVQPTHVLAGGASGHTLNPSEFPAFSRQLAILRDGLAAGEVTPSEAVSCLATLLASTFVAVKPGTAIDTTPRMPRLNFAGYCGICLNRNCQNPQCVRDWDRYSWKVCESCAGSGFADYQVGGPDNASIPCDYCTFGLVEVLSEIPRSGSSESNGVVTGGRAVQVNGHTLPKW